LRPTFLHVTPANMRLTAVMRVVRHIECHPER
jgi:hypothetical protein